MIAHKSEHQREDLSGVSETSYAIKTKFLKCKNISKGFYMLEVNLDFPKSQVYAQIDINDFKHRSKITNVFIKINPNKTTKRVIYLTQDSQVNINIPIATQFIECKILRLVRITEKFASDRMLNKLTLKEYKYKNKSSLSITHHQLPSLWNDYNALFSNRSDAAKYKEWITEFENNTIQIPFTIDYSPRISIIMPVFNPNLDWLREAIESVKNQSYENWELCIADDASTNSEVHQFLKQQITQDRRIKVTFRQINGHISAASNSALSLASGEWLILMDQDDVLAVHALSYVAKCFNMHTDCQLIYSDEDKINEINERSEPYFKCDWNLDLFYSQNMFSHLGAFKHQLVVSIGGFRIGFEGSQDYDLVLRCLEKISPSQIQHIPKVLYHWRIHSESTASGNSVKPYAITAANRALTEHFQRIQIDARVESLSHGYRIKYSLPPTPPLISLIIPTRDNVILLKKCIESILLKTTYPNYEIIVINNGSTCSSTLDYLNKIQKNSIIKVITDNSPFNYSALNNNAVNIANGSIIGLINDDIEVMTKSWLTELVTHAVRPDVGVVGAKLLYSDESVQHAGVILGLGGVAGHAHKFYPRNHTGYCGRAALTQSYSAVTGACLIVRKSIYLMVGGLNESDLTVGCNDIDFCLRVRKAGFRNIWTPFAELFHHESASRGHDDTSEKKLRASLECQYMHKTWENLLLEDPAYNPNLSLNHADEFQLAWPPRKTIYDV